MKLIDWVENMIRAIITKRCQHHYRKHYDKDSGGYVNRCTKCGKKVMKCRS